MRSPCGNSRQPAVCCREPRAPFRIDLLMETVENLPVIASRLLHHSEAIPAVVHVGEAAEQVACSRLGLVKLGSANQVHYGVGGDIKRVLVSIFLLGPGGGGGGGR